MTDGAPTPPPLTRDDVRVSDVTIAGAGAYLLEPPEGGRGPAALFLHWFDTQAPDGNRTQFLAEAAALAGAIGAVSVLPQGRFPWAGDPTDAEADAARIRAEVEAHRGALDLLAGRADVDAARIALVGHDFGVF